MSKLKLALYLSLISASSLPPCQAVPSLLCIPKTTYANAEVTEDKKRGQTITRRIRVYYVNGHLESEAKALIINNHVKAIIFRGTQGRPFAKSTIDSSGFGSGIDFRGMPWEFHGYLDP